MISIGLGKILFARLTKSLAFLAWRSALVATTRMRSGGTESSRATKRLKHSSPRFSASAPRILCSSKPAANCTFSDIDTTFRTSPWSNLAIAK